NQIDFAGIGHNIADMTRNLDQAINVPQLKSTMASLQATMKDVQEFSRKLNNASGPALAQLPDMANQLDQSLAKINKLAGSLNTAYGDESRFSRDLDRLLPQLNDMARSIRALTDLLARHPEALVTGRPAGKE
ncbi:MAG: hypothetical protein JOY81_08935, partial [Alphaproteobacteria bacterium]|nr:hypothetical protein [Alphaproteobacteria bacterium]